MVASTGVLFPFFSAVLGGLGGFLTGSNTSANALFGNLQVVTATRLNLSPVLMAAANSTGGMMAKMISLQSIAIAAVLASQFAAVGAVAAFFLFRERLSVGQRSGVVAIALGVAMLTAVRG